MEPGEKKKNGTWKGLSTLPRVTMTDLSLRVDAS